MAELIELETKYQDKLNKINWTHENEMDQFIEEQAVAFKDLLSKLGSLDGIIKMMKNKTRKMEVHTVSYKSHCFSMKNVTD